MRRKSLPTQKINCVGRLFILNDCALGPHSRAKALPLLLGTVPLLFLHNAGNSFGNDGDSGLGIAQSLFGQGQSLFQRMGRNHMQIPNNLVWGVADQNHPTFDQRSSKNLGLPLICLGLLLGHGQNFLKNIASVSVFGKGAVKSVASHAVLTLGGHDNHAARAAAKLGGGNSLDCLIDILVQRVAVVAGYHNIRRYGLISAQRGQKIGAFPVSLIKMTGKGGDQPLPAVDDSVDNERQSRPFRRPDHIFGLPSKQPARAWESAIKAAQWLA